MTGRNGGAGRQQLYEVSWISGPVAGVRHVWAPDEETARATLEENPALFGVPHEEVIVGLVVLLSIRIQDRAAVRD